MSERKTYKLHKLALSALRESIAHSRKNSEPGASAIEGLATGLLRSIDCYNDVAINELSRGNNHRQLLNALLAIASSISNGGPRWATQAAATLHIVERLLGVCPVNNGLLPSLAENIRIHRCRSTDCGTYSTPDFIANGLTSDLLREVEPKAIRSLQVADLSVEAGHFPLSLLSHCPDIPIRFYGIDRDPTAVGVSERIVNWSIKRSGSRQFHYNTANVDSIRDTLPHKWPKTFDAIIGNPPWKTLHCTDDKYLRTKYSQFLSGHFDVYLAFILRADELLKVGGLLSLVIPSGFLFNQNAAAVREKIMSQYEILALKLFPRRSFVELPCVVPISFLMRKSATPRNIITRVSYCQEKRGNRESQTRRFRASAIWKRLPGHVFHPEARACDMFLAELQGEAVLQELGVLRSGAMLSRRRAIRSSRNFTGYHARHVHMYHACDRHAKEYKSNNGAFDRAPPTHLIDCRKVFFQDIRCMTLAKRLVAAIGEKGTLSVNTASMFIPSCDSHAEFFAALLNSQLANAWYKLRDSNRDVRLNILGLLPIVFDETKWLSIASMAKQISSIRSFLHRYTESCSFRDECGVQETRFRKSLCRMKILQEQIDSAIFDLYSIPNSSRLAIKRLARIRVFRS